MTTRNFTTRHGSDHDYYLLANDPFHRQLREAKRLAGIERIASSYGVNFAIEVSEDGRTIVLRPGASQRFRYRPTREEPESFYHPHSPCELEESIPAQDSSALQEALQEIDEVPNDAKDDGLEVPSELALRNARRLLQEMYRISPRPYGIYPVSDGYVAIDARGRDGRIAVVMCGSDGEVLCLVTVGTEHRRARYTSADRLPDGFVREALSDLGNNPVK